MKIAVMQPYLFPYLGYFQLIQAVDKFVIYDDVQFTRKGWINRNTILLNGKSYRFTLPVARHRQCQSIREIGLSDFMLWKRRFLRTIDVAYKKAPFFQQIKPLIDNLLSSPVQSLIDILMGSLHMICDYLKIETPFLIASETYNNRHMKKVERILDICRREEANTYINLSGGKSLYDKDFFSQNGLELRFLEYNAEPYSQGSKVFIPFLSVLDVVMFNDPVKIKNEMLQGYKLS